MKEINKEDMKVGKFIYLEDKKDKERRFIIKIIKINISDKKEEYVNDWWGLGSKLFAMFEPIIIGQRDYGMEKKELEGFNIFRLNKKEILEFKRYLILKNL